MAEPLTPRSARELLACFDVTDDPLTQSFLSEILASGAAPPEEIELLRQLSVQTADEQVKEKKRKHRKKRKRAATVTAVPEEAPKEQEEEKGQEDEKDQEDSNTTRLVAVFTTTTVLNAESDRGEETTVHVVKKETKSGAEESLQDVLHESDRNDTTEVSQPEALQPFTTSSSSPPQTSKTKRQTTSHFFSSPSETTKDAGDVKPTTPKRTPRRVAVSGLPFAPLTADRFGLVQEELAHDPFWLLVALVFLVRVAGRISLPVFWRIKAAYPTPAALAAADPRALIAAMHHLGMATVRCATIQRYARQWLEQPPQAGVCTPVKNYPADEEDQEDQKPPQPSQWEICHLTQGAYFLDSWRIFCRDVLLGRATDWQGGGAPASFQPEWMRVRPRDKELRACLRWMWMREGWDWDPQTGERTVLQEALRQAVDEGRVGYDMHGQLQIVEV